MINATLAPIAYPTTPTPNPYCPTLRKSVYVLVLVGYYPTVPTLKSLPTNQQTQLLYQQFFAVHPLLELTYNPVLSYQRTSTAPTVAPKLEPPTTYEPKGSYPSTPTNPPTYPTHQQ